MNKCPVCDFEADDAHSQVAHMQTEHPKELAARLREEGFYDGAVEFEENQKAKWSAVNRIEDIIIEALFLANPRPTYREIAIKIVEAIDA